MPVKWPARYDKKTDRRKEWVALKKKHAAAIKASKVNFEAKLGPSLDKFELGIKKVATAGFGTKATLSDLEKVSQAGLTAKVAATEYLKKGAALSQPAQAELTKFLK